jgi:hypothetical protein
MEAQPDPVPQQGELDAAAARESSLLRKSAIGLAGGGLIAAGVVMLVTPGPGLLTIAGGLTLLSREFTTADKIVTRMRRETIDRVRSRRGVNEDAVADTEDPPPPS